jgi:hypothetical protein
MANGVEVLNPRLRWSSQHLHRNGQGMWTVLAPMAAQLVSAHDPRLADTLCHSR